MATTQVLLAIVADGHEMTLRTLTSVLTLQGVLMSRRDVGMTLELVVVRTVNDALDALHRDARFEAVAIVRATAGFDVDFVTSAVASGRDVVLASSPLPVVDWERVKATIAAGGEEPPEFAGNVYNVDLAGPAEGGYAPVAAVRDVAVGVVRRRVVDRIAEKFPEVVGRDKSGFALDRVVDGRFVPALESWLDMHRAAGGEVVADVVRRVVVAGPLEFAGSVGARARLR